MILYVVRHAIAVPREQERFADSERPLTSKGLARMRKAAAGMKRIGVAPAVVLSSPWVRARQTAEILVEALDPRPELELTGLLAPPADRSLLYDRLRDAARVKRIMLVGHQPSLGEIAGEIAWGSPERFVYLKKGSLCVLEVQRLVPPPQGRMVSLIPPAVLRKIGNAR